jgi:hypothetical protein
MYRRTLPRGGTWRPPEVPIDSPSESADVVTARAAAFQELKALIDKHRLDAESD